jgi:hypothetical protein
VGGVKSPPRETHVPPLRIRKESFRALEESTNNNLEHVVCFKGGIHCTFPLKTWRSEKELFAAQSVEEIVILS